MFLQSRLVAGWWRFVLLVFRARTIKRVAWLRRGARRGPGMGGLAAASPSLPCTCAHVLLCTSLQCNVLHRRCTQRTQCLSINRGTRIRNKAPKRLDTTIASIVTYELMQRRLSVQRLYSHVTSAVLEGPPSPHPPPPPTIGWGGWVGGGSGPCKAHFQRQDRDAVHTHHLASPCQHRAPHASATIIPQTHAHGMAHRAHAATARRMK